MQMLRLVLAIAAAALLTGCASDDRSAAYRSASESPAAAPHVRHTARVAIAAAGNNEVWASRVIGRPVNDARGRYLGKLVDFMIDMTTADVLYAIVSHAPAQGQELLVAVPVRSLRKVSGGDLFLDTSGGWHATPADGRGHRVSRLIGQYVAGPDGRQLGPIGEVVVALGRQSVRHMVLFYDPHPGVATEHAFAVPVGAFSWSGTGLALNVTPERLAALIGVDFDDRASTFGPRYIGAIDRSFPIDAAPVGGTR